MEIILTTVLFLLFLTATLGCDINKCQVAATPLAPAACADITKHLECLKVEFSKCTNDGARNNFMIMVPYSMQMYRPAFCGYDLDQIQKMFMARVGLVATMMNHTGGIPPIGFGDDGPFDDSHSFDDDGPFDDGPFDDSIEEGIIPAVLAAGVNAGNTQTEKPPQAPGLLPRFRGGAAMQTNNDDSKGGGSSTTAGLSLTLTLLVPVVLVSIL